MEENEIFKPLEIYQQDNLDKERRALVVKAKDLIQKTRYSLTTQENKIVLYILSKIQPTDTAFTEYKFSIKQFCKVCNIGNTNYDYIKRTMQNLRRKNFWIVIDSKGTESCVDWFSVVRTNKRSGIITVKFHEDLQPFLLELKSRFVKYSIFPTLAMKSQYSIRLYELLKSYDNLPEWWFSIPELKKKLDCEFYERYADFRRFVIDISISEINKYTDLDISYKAYRDGGREYAKIKFYINSKAPYFKIQASKAVSNVLDKKNCLEDDKNE